MANCPICDIQLEEESIEGISVLKCTRCNGLALQKGELNKLVQHKEGDLELSSIDHLPHVDDHTRINCVFCENTFLPKINFLQESDIILDYCEQCGSIWLDKGELPKIKSYMQKVDSSEAAEPEGFELNLVRFFSSFLPR